MSCSLIIPAHNEAGRIVAVLKPALACELVVEVLVVDDGSSDDTAREAEALGVRVLRHKVNRGKARAMESGLAATSGEVVAFLDGDLTGMTAEHIRHLLRPVISGSSGAALAVFRGGRIATTLAQRITPMISGQRCLRRELLDDFNSWDSRFGIETAINDHLRRHGISQIIVEWHGAGQVMKEEKRGFWAGLAARIRMYWEIVVVWVRSKVSRRAD